MPMDARQRAQLEAEMAAGRATAERHRQAEGNPDPLVERMEVLARYERSGFYRTNIDGEGNNHGMVALDGKNKKFTSVAAERRGPAWPSESFVAFVTLAMHSCVSPSEIPAESMGRETSRLARKRRDQYRKDFVMDWSKIK